MHKRKTVYTDRKSDFRTNFRSDSWIINYYKNWLNLQCFFKSEILVDRFLISNFFKSLSIIRFLLFKHSFLISNIETKKVLPEDLMRKFHSKGELYELLSVDRKPRFTSFVVQYCLPPFDKCSLHFLRKVLSGEKKVCWIFHRLV